MDSKCPYHSLYGDLIREATGETSEERLMEIEEIMRQDVFHSTLDCHTGGALRVGAKRAQAILNMRSSLPDKAGDLSVDEETGMVYYIGEDDDDNTNKED